MVRIRQKPSGPGWIEVFTERNITVTEKKKSNMKITRVGVAMAKNVFQAHGVNIVTFVSMLQSFPRSP